MRLRRCWFTDLYLLWRIGVSKDFTWLSTERLYPCPEGKLLTARTTTFL